MKRLLTAALFAAMMSGTALADTTLKLVEVITSPERTETLKSIVGKFEAANPGTKVEIEGLYPDTLVHALAMSGFYQRLLELAGARDVRANVLSCRERGDEATVTSLRWR